MNASKPISNYGSSTSLRADASPDLHSYLRFDVLGLGGKAITRARLLVYMESKTNQGIDLWRVANNGWNETTMNYNNAPALGSVLASSGPAGSPGSWVELDVTSYLNGEGSYSFGITSPSSTAIKFSSREGVFAPQLILDLQ